MFSSSSMQVTTQDKMARLAGRMAMAIAKSKGDSDYIKYAKVRKVLIALKTKLIHKYGMAGMKAARIAASRIK